MAKKSAKSKGYRKQTVKKPYLSKRDIVILCVLVAAIAVGAFFLFRYDDGALKVKNGAVVAEGDNWLIVNGSNVRGRARYFKLGEMGQLEGYAREASALATDANVPEYVFTPEDADSGVTDITVTSSHTGAETLAKYAETMMGSIDGAQTGEVQSATLAGHTAYYFITTTGPQPEEADAEQSDGEALEDAPAEDGDGEPAWTRTANGYIDAGHESSIAVHVQSSADAEEACLDEAALTAALEQTLAAVTLESAE